MRYSALYFIPTPGNTPDASSHILTSIVNNVESRFDSATRRESHWSLVHRLLRSVQPLPTSGAQPSQAQSLSYQHIVHISYLGQNKTYCYIHPFTAPAQTQNLQTSGSIKPEPITAPIKAEPNVKQEPSTPQPPSSHTTTQPLTSGTIISIPVSQSESHTTFLTTTLSPLWASRHALQVPNGISYTTGQYTVHLGVLNASRSGPSSSSAPISPGVVVCLTSTVGTDSESNNTRLDEGYESREGSSAWEQEEADLFGEAEQELRELWRLIKQGLDFGKAEVREVMMGKEPVAGEGEKEAAVRMWCEVLRLRG